MSIEQMHALLWCWPCPWCTLSEMLWGTRGLPGFVGCRCMHVYTCVYIYICMSEHTSVCSTNFLCSWPVELATFVHILEEKQPILVSLPPEELGNGTRPLVQAGIWAHNACFPAAHCREMTELVCVSCLSHVWKQLVPCACWKSFAAEWCAWGKAWLSPRFGVCVWVSGRLRCASALLGLFNKLLLWNLKAIVNLIAFKIEKLRLFWLKCFTALFSWFKTSETDTTFWCTSRRMNRI